MKKTHRLAIRIIFVAVAQSTDALKRLRHPHDLPDSIAGRDLQWLRLQQYRKDEENYDLICVDDKNLRNNNNVNMIKYRVSRLVNIIYPQFHFQFECIPNLCGLYPGKCVTSCQVSSVGVPNNLKILSS